MRFARHGASWTTVMWDEFERSAGKANFHHFMAFDGPRPVAVGALAVFERMGHLTAAATCERDRMRGAQSALIAARIDKARALGCTVLTVETLSMLKHSMRNLWRAGFRVTYEKEIYEWSSERDRDGAVATKPSPRAGGDRQDAGST